ncbi:MAG TPA: PAS domain S-box protein [Gemmatimonadales bacterium]|nr:PAS domain S-box protein [Gemmatimonadales bacterium]
MNASRGDSSAHWGCAEHGHGPAPSAAPTASDAALWSTVLDAIPDTIYIKDRESRFLAINQAQARVLGVAAPAEAIGRTDADFFPAEHAAAALADEREILRTGRSIIGKVERIEYPDGRRRWFSTTKIPLRDAGGAIVGTAGSSREITDLVAASRAAQESEEQLRLVLHAARMSAWEVELATRRIRWSEGADAVLGMPPDRLPQTVERFLDAVHPDDRSILEATLRAVAASDGPLQVEFRVVGSDGAQRWVAGTGRVVRDERGRPERMLGVAQDISERRTREESRRREVELLAAVLEAQQAVAMAGLDVQEALQETVERVRVLTRAGGAAVAFRQRDGLVIRAAAGAGTPGPGGHLRIGGSFVEPCFGETRVARWDDAGAPAPAGDGDLRALGIRSAIAVPLHQHGTAIGVLMVTSRAPMAFSEADLKALQLMAGVLVTALAQAATFEAMRASEERYRSFIEQTSEAVWCSEIDPPVPVALPAEEQVAWILRHGYVTEANDAMARMHGHDRAEEVVGSRMGETLGLDEPGRTACVRRFVDAGYRLADAESSRIDRQGRRRDFLSNLVGIVEAGVLRRVWGTQRDVTERRTLEEQLRQAQKMETIGQLAGGIAHDFNNLLTAILGNAALAETDLPPDSPAREDLREIRHAAERAATLTRQLLAFARRQVFSPRLLDPNELVLGLERMLRRLIGEPIELRTVLDPGVGAVRADPDQLAQVLINLAVNARDAMPDGGCLTIATANVSLPSAGLPTHPAMQPGEYVLLAVSDTGIGLTDEVRRRLFEPFFTTKPPGKGTGLGLATCYGIVKQSGGWIWADGAPGQGACFAIYLPRAAGAPAGLPPRPDQGPPARGSETVLVVEDDPAVRLLTTRTLRDLGYRVLTAVDGEEALQVAASHPGPLEALVTDVVMPRLGGKELAERLRRERPELPVLYTSGYAESMVAQRGGLEPGTDFLQKPFLPDELARRLRRLLDRTGPGGDLPESAG